ncbi:GOLD domain-containing protein [Entamoeba marina]
MTFFFLLFVSSLAFIIDVPTNGFRCISLDGFEAQRVAGTYRLAEGESLQHRDVILKILSNDGHSELFSDDAEEYPKTKEFGAFFTSDEEVLDICVIDSANKRSLQPVSVEIQLESETRAKPIATKQQTKSTEDIITDAALQSQQIHEFLLNCRRIEEQRRNLNEATNSATLWFMLLIISLVIGSTVWQIRYLKRYFVNRKFI